MSEKHALIVSFRSFGYGKPERFKSQVAALDNVTGLRIYSPLGVAGKLLSHPVNLLKNLSRGFGLFIWKAQVCINGLKKLKGEDFLVYFDLGIFVNSKARFGLERYFNQMALEGTEIGVFGTGNAYIRQNWVKAEVAEDYFPEFLEREEEYLYAGIIFIKNSSESRRILAEWNKLMKPAMLSRKCDLERQIDSWKGHDLDNGILSLVLSKHREKVSIFDYRELNLYDSHGVQLKHCLSKEAYEAVDWSPLDSFPLQMRRDR